MKKKSYNIFIALSLFLLVISLVFFLIIKNNMQKNEESSFLKRITVNDNPIDFDKLTPLEKEVWNKFQQIPKKEYSYKYKEIAENNRVLLNNYSSENIGAYILKEILDSGELSPKKRLFILNKLRVLDAPTGNIVNSKK